VTKPAVVLFGEPVRGLDRVADALADCPLLLAIGTSAEVAPACLIPERVLATGGSTIEFNTEPALSDRVLGSGGARVVGPVGRTLPRILEIVRSRSRGSA
jgi:NAD-dependent deacetylase